LRSERKLPWLITETGKPFESPLDATAKSPRCTQSADPSVNGV
jgi:hypothetical protein